MTIESDEITMGNPKFVHGFIYSIHTNATAMLVNH